MNELDRQFSVFSRPLCFRLQIVSCVHLAMITIGSQVVANEQRERQLPFSSGRSNWAEGIPLIRFLASELVRRSWEPAQRQRC